MISAWWLLPAFLLGAVGGFFLFVWLDGLLARWEQEDDMRRAEENRAFWRAQIPRKVRKIWPDITKSEMKALESLNRLSGREFEELIGRLFERMGYAVDLVGGTGDHGIDLIASNESERVVVQCKRYSVLTSISNNELRNFIGAALPHQPCRAILVTTSYLTPKAEEYKQMSGVEVWSGRDTVRLLLEHGLLQAGRKRERAGHTTGKAQGQPDEASIRSHSDTSSSA